MVLIISQNKKKANSFPSETSGSSTYYNVSLTKDGTVPQHAVREQQMVPEIEKLFNSLLDVDTENEKKKVWVASTEELQGYVESSVEAEGKNAFPTAPSKIDGFDLIPGLHVLINHQTDKKQNGIYKVLSVNALNKTSVLQRHPKNSQFILKNNQYIFQVMRGEKNGGLMYSSVIIGDTKPNLDETEIEFEENPLGYTDIEPGNVYPVLSQGAGYHKINEQGPENNIYEITSFMKLQPDEIKIIENMNVNHPVQIKTQKDPSGNPYYLFTFVDGEDNQVFTEGVSLKPGERFMFKRDGETSNLVVEGYSGVGANELGKL